jgi:hypothetical protein
MGLLSLKDNSLSFRSRFGISHVFAVLRRHHAAVVPSRASCFPLCTSVYFQGFSLENFFRPLPSVSA